MSKKKQSEKKLVIEWRENQVSNREERELRSKLERGSRENRCMIPKGIADYIWSTIGGLPNYVTEAYITVCTLYGTVDFYCFDEKGCKGGH